MKLWLVDVNLNIQTINYEGGDWGRFRTMSFGSEIGEVMLINDCPDYEYLKRVTSEQRPAPELGIYAGFTTEKEAKEFVQNAQVCEGNLKALIPEILSNYFRGKYVVFRQYRGWVHEVKIIGKAEPGDPQRIVISMCADATPLEFHTDHTNGCGSGIYDRPFHFNDFATFGEFEDFLVYDSREDYIIDRSRKHNA